MADVNEVRNGEVEHVSLQVAGIQGDLLQRFFSGNHPPKKFKQEAEEEEPGGEEIELSLGLSMNGRFGVDPEKAKRLKRSSSISDFFLSSARRGVGGVVDGGAWPGPSEYTTPLARTCSLPAETEEWRKRKELQSLRRMEAKRKQTEKQMVFRVAAAAVPPELHYVDDSDIKKGGVVNWGRQEHHEQLREVPKEFILPGWPPGRSNWGTAASVRVESRPDRANSLGRSCGGEGAVPPSSLQGSNGSQGSGSGSSWISDFDSHMVPDMTKNIEARSPNSVQSRRQQKEQKPAATLGNRPAQKLFGGEAKEAIVRNVIEDMPCVSTTGDGPNGKKIEGFLYRYKKGEEVRIVCVCHGTFLSPAEFVKHAGGGDVAHPLRRIVVNTASFL